MKNKQLLLTFLGFLLFQISYAQSFTVCNLRENIVYVGIPNPIEVTVENTDNKDILLTSKDATLTKEGNGTYDLDVSKTGKLSVVVWKKNKKGKLDSLGNALFRAHSIPEPIAKVSGIHFGEIKKSVLTASNGIIVLIEGMDLESKSIVTSYNCIIIYKNGNTKLFPSNDALFTENIKMEFSFLQPSEQVLFCNIKCVGPDGKVRNIEPIELTVSK